MSGFSSEPQSFADVFRLPILGKDQRYRVVIGWSSFFFALLQSICTAFLALSGLRLLIGVGSIALSAGAAATMEGLHADRIRLPMVGLAFLGSLLNLAVLSQIQYLRKRPASRWRQRAISPKEFRMERIQWVLSLATLILLATEEFLHLNRFHGL